MTRSDFATSSHASAGRTAEGLPSASAAPSRDRIIGFDLLRGVAALLVLVYHVDFAFGLRHALLVGGYLAVDLFFVLSGFVLAFNYRRAIRDGSTDLREFLVARIARLYPLFLATTAIGIPIVIARMASQGAAPDSFEAVTTALLNFAILPSFWFRGIDTAIFPYNAASWSIFFEMLASLAFFIWLARLRLGGLAVVAVASLASLAWAVLAFGSADVGYGTANILAGFPRVAFSFCMGLLLYEFWTRSPWQASVGWLLSLLVAFLAVVQLKFWVPPSLTPWLDLALVAFLIPALVASGAAAKLRGGLATTATFLGDISYSVYLVQAPMILLLAGLCKALLGREIASLAPWSGAVMVAIIVGLSWVTFHLVEMPARRLIRRRWSARRTGQTRQAAS